MRYISDLHVGRVNPKHFEFGIDVEQKRYDLPQFLAHQLLGASNVAQVLNEVEPPYLAYQRTEVALQMYLALAAQDHSLPLPEVQKTLVAGDSYAAVEGLAQRLHLLGDLPQSAFANIKSGIYDGALVDAVKRFQSRHGLGADGKLDKKTAAAAECAVELSCPAVGGCVGEMEMAAGRLFTAAGRGKHPRVCFAGLFKRSPHCPAHERRGGQSGAP